MGSEATQPSRALRLSRVFVGAALVTGGIGAVFVGHGDLHHALMSAGNGPWLWLLFAGPLISCAGLGVATASAAPSPVYARRAAAHGLIATSVGLGLLGVFSVLIIIWACGGVVSLAIAAALFAAGRKLAKSTDIAPRVAGT